MAEHLLPGSPCDLSSDGIGEDWQSYAVTTGTRTNETFPKAEEEKQDAELLPGILNEITLNHITTKLPWSALSILPCISREWRRAIQDRRVHDARVRTHSTETLLLHPHAHGEDSSILQKIGMFSMRDKGCYVLPPIPQLEGGIPRHCHFVPLNGKIFVMAAGKEYSRVSKLYSGVEVYMLDLAGQRQWKQCASMPGNRERFGCGAVGGKVYIIGGVDSDLLPLPGCEVYDPNVDAWSPIMPMPRMRTHTYVDTLGDELFVHGGTAYHPDYITWCTVYVPNDLRRPQDFRLHGRFADVYNPAKDEWRLIDPFERDSYELVFGAQGQLFTLSREGINVFDSVTKTWKDLHSHSFANLFAAEIGPIDGVRLLLTTPVAANDELLVLVFWYKVTIEDGFDEVNNGGYFLQSKGFLGQNREVSWQIISKCSRTWGDVNYSIQL